MIQRTSVYLHACQTTEIPFRLASTALHRQAEEGINYLEVVEVNRRNTTLHTHARITLPQCEAPAP